MRFSPVWLIRILRIGFVVVSVAQTVTIDPVGAVTVVEGDNLTITCTDGVNIGTVFALLENGVPSLGGNTPNEVNGMVRIFHLSVDRTKDGNTYYCVSLFTAMVSPVITLTVTCKWSWQ